MQNFGLTFREEWLMCVIYLAHRFKQGFWRVPGYQRCLNRSRLTPAVLLSCVVHEEREEGREGWGVRIGSLCWHSPDLLRQQVEVEGFEQHIVSKRRFITAALEVQVGGVREGVDAAVSSARDGQRHWVYWFQPPHRILPGPANSVKGGRGRRCSIRDYMKHCKKIRRYLIYPRWDVIEERNTKHLQQIMDCECSHFDSNHMW